MPDNYIMKVNDKGGVNVRLVGIISEREAEAVMNTEEAAKKISTAENIDLKDTKVPSPFNNRFVVVIRDHKIMVGPETSHEMAEITAKKLPTLFVSAIVERMSYASQNKILHTKDKNKYQFIPIEKKAAT